MATQGCDALDRGKATVLLDFARITRGSILAYMRTPMAKHRHWLTGGRANRAREPVYMHPGTLHNGDAYTASETAPCVGSHTSELCAVGDDQIWKKSNECHRPQLTGNFCW